MVPVLPILMAVYLIIFLLHKPMATNYIHPFTHGCTSQSSSMKHWYKPRVCIITKIRYTTIVPNNSCTAKLLCTIICSYVGLVTVFLINCRRKSITLWTGREATCVSGSTVEESSAASTSPAAGRRAVSKRLSDFSCTNNYAS